MNRRNFVTQVLLTGSMLGMGIGCSRKTESSLKDEITGERTAPWGPDMITEPARQVRVLAHTDVLVIGGGPAGTAAAIAASRAGAETYLVEGYHWDLSAYWTWSRSRGCTGSKRTRNGEKHRRGKAKTAAERAGSMAGINR